ncbi:MAG: DUF4301 family protein [Porphyromonas sp.]|nr:DUF4301 family protein [Porphyromonas sp.]
MEIKLTEEDLSQLKQKGISQKTLEAQLSRFEQGFKPINIVAPAGVEGGVKVFDNEELGDLLKVWDDALMSPELKVQKFVPASGAASRMFKELYKYLKGAEPSESVTQVIEHLDDFAFSDALDRACMLGEGGKSSAKLIEIGEGRTVIRYLLEEEGMNYGHLPKALILFHRYAHGTRTATEEQLAESAKYASNSTRIVHVHFTLSPEHIAPFQTLLSRRLSDLEDRYSVKYDVTYSIQKPETDTIAVDLNNQPMRGEDGSLMFRPGGHGALIENLNELDADIIFIKNIDNVVPDHYVADTIIYKKAIGGYLITLRNQVHKYMAELSEEGRPSSSELEEMREFLETAFCVTIENWSELSPDAQADQLRELLNRPIRVCGMVRNEGEPGGGPYIVRDAEGVTSLQILESTQINREDPEQREAFNKSTYFNPVDLVCCVRAYKGQKFDLTAFVDEETGFMSHKSSGARDLKALELPGLWNGAMSRWNTAFVEVPVTTFNPVKTVNDLLRPVHQYNR